MSKFLKLVTILSLLFFISPASAQNCTCAEVFEQVIEVYENDYALFNIKVTDLNSELYIANTAVFRDKANAVSKIEDCLPVLEQWLQFFRDGHNNVKYAGISGTERGRIEIDRKAFISEIEKFQKMKPYRGNDLLGIWKYGAYEVGIMPDPDRDGGVNNFVGVVLNSKSSTWQPGDVRFELNQIYGNDYDAIYYMDDNSSRKLSARQKDPVKLDFVDYNIWTKIWPAKAQTAAEDTDLYSDFHIRLIDGEIPYIRFPNFYEKEPAFIDSLLQSHHKELVNADFIIVDVRDNNGGNDVVYKPVLPYILSGPIETPYNGIWMSKGNLEIFLEGKDPNKMEESERAEYDYLMSLRNTIFWPNGEKYSSTFLPDTLFAPHQKVGVLINEKTISSGETFVYRVKQSDKVVLYGQNTAGIVDGFNVLTRTIDCFNLRFPSSLRAKDVAENPIDPYGMEPDVYISPELDALDFSIEHMKELISRRNHPELPEDKK